MDHVELILHNGLWSFDNYVLVVVRLKRGDTPSAVNLTMLDFWVHVLDVPFD